MIQLQAIKTIAVAGILIATFFAAMPVFAQEYGNPKDFAAGLNSLKSVREQNKLAPGSSTKEILQTITKWLLSLIGTIAVISLLYGGYLYITSQGEEDKAEQAKTIILYSVIGIIIIGISAIVVNVVINVATSS